MHANKVIIEKNNKEHRYHSRLKMHLIKFARCRTNIIMPKKGESEKTPEKKYMDQTWSGKKIIESMYNFVDWILQKRANINEYKILDCALK